MTNIHSIAITRAVAPSSIAPLAFVAHPTAVTIAATMMRAAARIGIAFFVALCLGACAAFHEPSRPTAEKETTVRLPKATAPNKICRGTAYSYYVDGRRAWIRKIATLSADTEQYGIASWYGHPFHGRITANGERYDMHGATAAHKSLPMNSLVEVTNLLNGKRTIVRINDRGPFIDGRIIDLSFGAAGEIDMRKPGIVPVRVLVIHRGSRKSRYKRDGAL